MNALSTTTGIGKVSPIVGCGQVVGPCATSVLQIVTDSPVSATCKVIGGSRPVGLPHKSPPKRMPSLPVRLSSLAVMGYIQRRTREG